ncbi:hypothetical protein KDL45_09755 [bacterium]|nr:hypothetical protein [bacterium]
MTGLLWSSALVPALVMALICAAVPAHAGTISLTTWSEVTTDSDLGESLLTVHARNEGDEAARNVQAHVEFAGEKYSGPKWEELRPGEEKSHQFELTKLPENTGTYPIFMTVDFSDLNLYPFTALNVTAYQVGEFTPRAKIFAKADSVELKKKGTFKVELSNTNDEPKSVTGRIMSPDEIQINPANFTKELGANENTTMEFELNNLSAQPGASYPLILVMEYDKDGTHHYAQLVSQMSIAAGGIAQNDRNTIVYVALGVIGAIVLVEILRRSRAKS